MMDGDHRLFLTLTEQPHLERQVRRRAGNRCEGCILEDHEGIPAERAAPTRHPTAHLRWRELEWWTAGREGVIGAVVLDRTDRDYAWIVLGKGRDGCYRPLGLGHSRRDQKTARRALRAAMAAATVPPAGLPDAAFAAADAAMVGEGAAAMGATVDDMLAQVRATLDDWEALR